MSADGNVTDYIGGAIRNILAQVPPVRRGAIH